MAFKLGLSTALLLATRTQSQWEPLSGPLNITGNETQLQCGDTYEGNRAVFETVYFTFTSGANHNGFVLESCKSDHDTYLYLYDANGTFLQQADDGNNYTAADCIGGNQPGAGDLAYYPPSGISVGSVYYFGVSGYYQAEGYYHIQLLCNVSTDSNVTFEPGLCCQCMTSSSTAGCAADTECEAEICVVGGGHTSCCDMGWDENCAIEAAITCYATPENITNTTSCEDDGQPVCCGNTVYASACDAAHCPYGVTLVADMVCEGDTDACPTGSDLTEIGRNECCEFDYDNCCANVCGDGSVIGGYYFDSTSSCQYTHECGVCPEATTTTFQCPASSAMGAITLNLTDNCEFAYEQCCAEEEGCVTVVEYNAANDTIVCNYQCTTTPSPTLTVSVGPETTSSDFVCSDRDWLFSESVVQSVCSFCSCSGGQADECMSIATTSEFTASLAALFAAACPVAQYPALANSDGEQCDIESVAAKSGYSFCDCNAIRCTTETSAARNTCLNEIVLLVLFVVASCSSM